MTRQAGSHGGGRVVRTARRSDDDPRPLAATAQGRAALAGLAAPEEVDLDHPVRLGPLDATALHGAVRAVLVAVGRPDLLGSAPLLSLGRIGRDGGPVPTRDALAIGRFCLVFGTVDATLGAGLRRLLHLLWLVDRVGLAPAAGRTRR